MRSVRGGCKLKRLSFPLFCTHAPPFPVGVTPVHLSGHKRSGIHEKCRLAPPRPRPFCPTSWLFALPPPLMPPPLLRPLTPVCSTTNWFPTSRCSRGLRLLTPKWLLDWRRMAAAIADGSPTMPLRSRLRRRRSPPSQQSLLHRDSFQNEI